MRDKYFIRLEMFPWLESNEEIQELTEIAEKWASDNRMVQDDIPSLGYKIRSLELFYEFYIDELHLFEQHFLFRRKIKDRLQNNCTDKLQNILGAKMKKRWDNLIQILIKLNDKGLISDNRLQEEFEEKYSPYELMDHEGYKKWKKSRG